MVGFLSKLSDYPEWMENVAEVRFISG